MRRRPPRPTRTDTLFPYSALFRPQQAILQVLEPLLDPGFSGSSYGFRPGRSAHDALRQARDYVADGHGTVVDLDLEKFFDRRSEEHTSELQSLMRISYAVFCFKKKNLTYTTRYYPRYTYL